MNSENSQEEEMMEGMKKIVDGLIAVDQSRNKKIEEYLSDISSTLKGIATSLDLIAHKNDQSPSVIHEVHEESDAIEESQDSAPEIDCQLGDIPAIPAIPKGLYRGMNYDDRHWAWSMSYDKSKATRSAYGLAVSFTIRMEKSGNEDFSNAIMSKDMDSLIRIFMETNKAGTSSYAKNICSKMMEYDEHRKSISSGVDAQSGDNSQSADLTSFECLFGPEVEPVDERPSKNNSFRSLKEATDILIKENESSSYNVERVNQCSKAIKEYADKNGLAIRLISSSAINDIMRICVNKGVSIYYARRMRKYIMRLIDIMGGDRAYLAKNDQETIRRPMGLDCLVDMDLIDMTSMIEKYDERPRGKKGNDAPFMTVPNYFPSDTTILRATGFDVPSELVCTGGIKVCGLDAEMHVAVGRSSDLRAATIFDSSKFYLENKYIYVEISDIKNPSCDKILKFESRENANKAVSEWIMYGDIRCGDKIINSFRNISEVASDIISGMTNCWVMYGISSSGEITIESISESKEESSEDFFSINVSTDENGKRKAKISDEKYLVGSGKDMPMALMTKSNRLAWSTINDSCILIKMRRHPTPYEIATAIVKSTTKECGIFTNARAILEKCFQMGILNGDNCNEILKLTGIPSNITAPYVKQETIRVF